MSIILKLPLMFTKKYSVLWPDLDANWHFANHSYIKYSADTRMSFFDSIGLTKDKLEAHMRGPVVFYEHMYYFKEVCPGKPVRVSLEVAGMSEDGCFFEFRHNFYDYKGRNVGYCEMMGAWISLKTRQLTPLSPEMLERFSDKERTEDFRFLTKEDTRKFAKKPKDLA